MCREPKPSRLDEYGKRGLGRELVGQPAGRRGDPTLLEEAVREVLVARAPHDLQRGQQHGRPERFTLGGQQLVVEVGKWHDEPHAVGVDQLTKRAQIGGIVDARNEREVVGVVERGRKLVDVGGDRRRPRPAEGGDDVDALPRAGEEDGRHSADKNREAIAPEGAVTVPARSRVTVGWIPSLRSQWGGGWGYLF